MQCQVKYSVAVCDPFIGLSDIYCIKLELSNDASYVFVGLASGLSQLIFRSKYFSADSLFHTHNYIESKNILKADWLLRIVPPARTKCLSSQSGSGRTTFLGTDVGSYEPSSVNKGSELYGRTLVYNKPQTQARSVNACIMRSRYSRPCWH